MIFTLTMAVLYAVTGAILASLLWFSIVWVALLRLPVAVLDHVIRRLERARLVGTPLEDVLGELRVARRRFEKQRRQTP